MVYDFGGKSHSSPSFSYSRSHNPYYSEAQREEDRKFEREERKKLEAQVASSRLDIPPSVQKKHHNSHSQLWREFRRTIYAHHGKDTVFALDRAIKTNSLWWKEYCSPKVRCHWKSIKCTWQKGEEQLKKEGLLR